jgi:hypothetical protein
VYLKSSGPRPCLERRIKELTRRATDKAMERAAISKGWVMEQLRLNAEKALESPHGSSVANRALELIGTELGMFRSDGPPKRLTLEDLTADELRELLGDAAPPEPDVLQ